MSNSNGLESSASTALSSFLKEYAFGKPCALGINRVLRQVHPDLTMGESGMDFLRDFLHTLMSRLAHTNTAIPQQPNQPAAGETVFTPGAPITNKEQLLARIQQVLAGELVQHATSEANKPCTNYATAMKLKVDKIDGAPNAAAACSDDDIRKKSGLVFPLVGYSCWPVSVRLMVTGVVEYVTAELIELAGNRARGADLKLKCINSMHFAIAIQDDEEFAGIARSLGKVDRRTAEEKWADLFPHTQTQLRELNRYAWYNHPAQVESVLAKFLSGELPQGDPALEKFHIRPVAYFGRNKHPIHFNAGGNDDDDDDDDDESGMVSPMELAFDLVAFDLIDAAGREFPLLVEFRLDSGDGRFYLARGFVLHRVTSASIGEIENTDQWRGELKIGSFEIEHERGQLKQYEPHHVTAELFEDAFGQIKPASGEPDEGEEGTITNEIESIICAAIKLVCCWGSEDSLPELSRFQLMHPPHVITRFTNELYRAAFDSHQVKATLRDDFHLPNDLLNVIGDYAPVDLPYIPLDPALGKAPLDARTGTGSNSAIGAGIPSTAAKRSSADAALADHTVTAAVPIPDDASHSADSDIGAPPANKKQKFIGENPTDNPACGTVSGTVSTGSSVTAASPSVSEPDSAITPSVIYPDDKWTKVIPSSEVSSRFVAANGRSFNFWVMIEDKIYADDEEEEDEE